MTAKFRNVRTVVDGIEFASKREAARYGELRLLERAAQIKDLRIQPRFPLSVEGKKVCTYVADFAYRTAALGVEIVEDVKSPITRKHPVYRIKAKLFEAIHGFPVTEV